MASGGRDERAAAPAFVADVMLGRLARWLRQLGFDVAYERHWDDRTIVRVAAREGRTVLTRDRGLAARRAVRRALLIRDEELGAQLRQVLSAFGLTVDRERFGTRCGACNGRLVEVPRESVAGVVPPFVFRHQTAFRRCEGCGRIYWRGTHDRLFRERLRRLLGEGNGPPHSG